MASQPEQPIVNEASGDQRPLAWKRRKSFRRVEILEAAVIALEEYGADGVSMIEVGRRAGVSEATIYKYFTNRNHLIGEALAQGLEPFLSDLERQVPLATGCHNRLLLYTTRLLHHMMEHPHFYQTRSAPMRWSAAYNEELPEVIDRFRALQTWILEQGIASRELDSGLDLSIASDMLVGGMLLFGWRAHQQAGRCTDDLDLIARNIVGQLIGGIVHPPAPAAGAADAG